MQRKAVFIVLILGILLLVFLLIRLFITNRVPRQGILKVSSNVAARVLLDNRDIGRTPLEQKVNVGEYTVRLVPDSASRTLASWQGRVTVSGNTVSYINRDLAETELTSSGEQLWLEKVSGNGTELSIISVPDGANVLVNDQSRGVTPVILQDLPAGEHTIVVSSPGFESRTVRVRLSSGYRVISSVFMAISPSQIANPVVIPTEEATVSATMESRVLSSTPAVSVTPTRTVSPTRTPSATPSPTRAAAAARTPTPTRTTAAASKVRILDTPTGFLRVRKEPSTAAEEVGRATPGEEYDVIKQQGTWYQISFNQSQGWISAQYAEKVE